MIPLSELLTADDQQVARQVLCAKGLEVGEADSARPDPVGADTLVVMSPLDADFFGSAYLQALGSNQPGRWAVVWHNVYDAPGEQEAAIEVHRYQSSAAPVSKAVILCSLGTSAAQIRGMFLFALDQGIAFHECRIECPWMSETVFEKLLKDLSFEYQPLKDDGVNIVPAWLLDGVELSHLTNLPPQGLSYLPAMVCSQI
ncbi:hypothetical protein [Pseudomonas putida]|uniref:Uncharacterized protein n=1 Tax=Pseudomonas putida TaxID=303 RepID=A0A8I1ECR7_PSEPU|nr:hypothetical protein [Pseudomonas putida]MBI6883136.1 hypothetical protein [Pseudomonas putida]